MGLGLKEGTYSSDRMTRKSVVGIVCGLALLAGLSSALPAEESGKELLPLFGQPLQSAAKVPRSAVETLRVELGRILYHDKRLSRDNSISCNSCHDTRRFGVDGKRFSEGFGNHLTGRNSPSSFNAFMHIAQFWDGRAPTVEEQAKGPILAAGEMAMPSGEEVVEKLGGISGYKELFAAAFPNRDPPITYDNVGEAIGAYERLFVTPGRFDRWLAGEEEALIERERRGLAKFAAYACTTCHSGTLLGGTSYQKLGLVKAWPNQKDAGRYRGDEARGGSNVFQGAFASQCGGDRSLFSRRFGGHSGAGR